ncbi:MAG: aminotransferase class IV [Clostridiales bacterium]
MDNNIGEFSIYNGEIVNSNYQKIENILNKGVKYYEVIRIINYKPIFLEDHIKRLYNSLDNKKSINLPEKKQFSIYINKLLKINKYSDCNIKIIYNKDFLSFAIFINKFYYPEKNEYVKGVNTVSLKLVRNNPNKKILNDEYIKIINEIKKEKNVFEIILLNENNYITEGSRSNVFFIKDNYLITMSDDNVLKGITREYVIKYCNDNKIKLVKKEIKYKELKEISVIFLTGTSINILPVKKIDNISFDFEKNIILKKIMKGFIEYIK